MNADVDVGLPDLNDIFWCRCAVLFKIVMEHPELYVKSGVDEHRTRVFT